MHHTETHSHDPRLVRRIKNVAWVNRVVGITELLVGLTANSATLAAAGVHDLSDGEIFHMESRAANQKDTIKKQKLRKYGAAAMIGAAFAIGAGELAHEQMSESKPDPIVAWVGIGSATTSLAGIAIMRKHRGHNDAHDSWQHIVAVDAPGAIVTLVAAPLSVRHPEIDLIGMAAHISIATAVGMSRINSANRAIAEASLQTSPR